MKDTLTPRLLDLMRRFEQQSIGFAAMREAEKPVPPKKPLPKPEPKKADPKAEKPDFKKDKNPSSKDPKKPEPDKPEEPEPRKIDMDDIPKTESVTLCKCGHDKQSHENIREPRCDKCYCQSYQPDPEGKWRKMKTEASALNPAFTQRQNSGDSGSFGEIPEDKEEDMDSLTKRLTKTEATKAEKAAYRAERLARLRDNGNILKTGVCPQCGTKLARNSSMTGWWQCGHVGSPGFQAEPGPPCSFQFFYDPSPEEAAALREAVGDTIDDYFKPEAGAYTIRLSRRTPSSQWDSYVSHPQGGGSGGNLSRYDGMENVLASVLAGISDNWMPVGSPYRLVVIVGNTIKRDEQRFKTNSVPMRVSSYSDEMGR